MVWNANDNLLNDFLTQDKSDQEWIIQTYTTLFAETLLVVFQSYKDFG